MGGVELSHADRQLWPGITKRELAEYWQAVAEAALPGLARRPLAMVRCPDGIGGEHFFQKNGHGFIPPRSGRGTPRLPYLAIDDVDGLIAMAQMSAIELHPWGAGEADPTHPDRLVFDLDPGEGVPWPEVIKAAHEVRARLGQLQLESWCRTTGGKGLHVVVPLRAGCDWERAKQFCRAFAEEMAPESPERYLAHLKIADRRGRILIDWLRNGSATAVALLSERPARRHGGGTGRLERGYPQAGSRPLHAPDGSRAARSAPKQSVARLLRCGSALADLAPTPKREAARAPALPKSASAPRARIVVARKPRKRA